MNDLNFYDEMTVDKSFEMNDISDLFKESAKYGNEVSGNESSDRKNETKQNKEEK